MKDMIMICERNFGFCLKLGKNYDDFLIATKLGLTKKEYQNILIKCGGYRCKKFCNDIIFNIRKNVEKAIIELNPYLIMYKIIGDEE